jgi:hypothetical protein
MDGLISIVADMLRSAISWEEENGHLPEFRHGNVLTGMPPEYKLRLLQNLQRGEADEHIGNIEKQPPQINF